MMLKHNVIDYNSISSSKWDMQEYQQSTNREKQFSISQVQSEGYV